MKRLNEVAATTEADRLVYDGSHPQDGKNVTITVAAGAVLKRGQLIDIGSDGSRSVHATDGTPDCIVAEEVAAGSEDTSVVAQVYISGTFRQDAVVTAAELTAGNIETLRGKGIYLK